ncbi:MAG: phosphopentomutase [Clostridia bacterium]
MVNRVFLVVLDSLGIGEMADAAIFFDEGSNTLKSISKSSYFNAPNLKKLGMFNIEGIDYYGKENNPKGSYARLKELSKGKDTTIGHWEIAGLVSKNPLPTYPNGFPKEVIDKFEKATGRKTVCNKPYSGTEVIKDYGQHHIETGDLIVYTSADSVFQIAAHEEVVPLKQLYEYCQIARNILQGEYAVGRVIARPFVGEYPEFKRTSNRHDFSLSPTGKTMLNVLQENGYETKGIGKIFDIFAGNGISNTVSIKNNDDGMEKTLEAAKQDFNGLCFVNLVDFDMLYGHRNDIDGYAKAVTAFDIQLKELLSLLRDDDVLILTADHGCDPYTPSTDHSREYVPMVITGKQIKKGVDLKTIDGFNCIAASILDMFNIKNEMGESFWKSVT